MMAKGVLFKKKKKCLSHYFSTQHEENPHLAVTGIES
jgi:hypothetical protein